MLSFVGRSLIAVLLTSMLTGLLGSYVVARRMVFISGGVTHSSFAGLGFGFYMGISPLLSAMGSAVLSALGVQWLSQRGGVREDSAIAAIWSLGMALGIIFTFLTPGYTPSLSSFLFGNILLITTSELLMLGIFLVLSILLVTLLYWPLLWISFDPEQAELSGLKVKRFQYGMIIWMALSIVLCIRAMGIMMLMSMLTIPQMTVSLFFHRFHHILIFSILYSMLVVGIAFGISLYVNIPTGALSVLLFAIVFLFLKLILWLGVRRKAGSK